MPAVPQAVPQQAAPPHQMHRAEGRCRFRFSLRTLLVPRPPRDRDRANGHVLTRHVLRRVLVVVDALVGRLGAEVQVRVLVPGEAVLVVLGGHLGGHQGARAEQQPQRQHLEHQEGLRCADRQKTPVSRTTFPPRTAPHARTWGMASWTVPNPHARRTRLKDS